MFASRIKFLLTLALFAPLQGAGPGQTPDAYRVIQRWSIGGEGGWDHLADDPKNHRLYVTRGDRVVVVDTGTGKAVGEIAGSQNVHYVCLDPSGNYGWITDGAAGAVRVFDRESLQVMASIPAGVNPNAAVFDTASQSLFVFPERGNTAVAFSAISRQRLGEVSFPGTPAVAVSDDKGSLFVSIRTLSQIVRVNTVSRTITAAWPIAGCVGPAGLVIDKASRQLYTACENRKLVTLDATTGKLLGSLNLPEGTRELAIDSQRKLIFAANGGGALTVIKQTSAGILSVRQTIKTQPGARTLAFDPLTKRIYLATAQFGLRTGDTSEELRYRPTPVPGSFVVLVVGE
jgi:DNA-binding beta-propeller fold protein YncE